MAHNFRQLVVIVLLVFSFSYLQSQDFKYGTKIAFITNIDKWLSVCEDCQELNDPSVRLTVMSNTNATGSPDKASVWTVERQDGKYRFKSAWNTYMRVCLKCRKDRPNGALVVADARLNNQGKVPPEALFDIISLKKSPYYQIISFQGKYLTRNYSATGMKKGSHILMAYYGESCRDASKFKIIELEEQSHTVVMDHPELKKIGWIGALNGDGFNRYMTKALSSQKIIIPKTGDLTEGTENSLFGPRFYNNTWFIGYSASGNGTAKYVNFDSDINSLNVGELTGYKEQLWNLIRLGYTKSRLGKKEMVFFIKNLKNEAYLGINENIPVPVTANEATIFMFEQSPSGLTGKRPDIEMNFEVLNVPGTNMAIINPNTVPAANFYWTQKIYLDKKFNYQGANWRMASLTEIQKIHKAFAGKYCYLDLKGQYYYINNSGQQGYIHPHYMGLINEDEVVFSSYDDKSKKRKVFLIREP